MRWNEIDLSDLRTQQYPAERKTAGSGTPTKALRFDFMHDQYLQIAEKCTKRVGWKTIFFTSNVGRVIIICGELRADKIAV